jgi:phosphomannomutase/phosphoglucomutase
MAQVEVKLPKMGESVAEATITTWLKQVGDTVEAEESIVEIATDKVDSEVPSPADGVITQIMFEEGEHYAFMEKFKKIADFGDAKISTIDGMRVTWNKGWGLIRPSNTTPCLVLRFEAEDEASLNEIQENFRKQILATDSSIELNF